MDPHNFIARAEAQRWLGIAEKLLIGNDLLGSKTFAIRARDSDPRLEAADQILAIADTLIAADKRVLSSNGSHQPDYYSILQLVQFVHDHEHISQQYRRLAVLLNPHNNRFPYADQAFQLVNDAYDVVSNPIRKSLYDSQLEYLHHQQHNINIHNNNNSNINLGFNINIEQNQNQNQNQQHNQQQHQHNFFSINPPEAELMQPRVQIQQQHNFLSGNSVRGVRVREPEQLFQRSGHEMLFQQQPQPFQAAAQMSFSWPQAIPQAPQLFPQQQQQQQQEESLQREAVNQSNDNAREKEAEVEAEADMEDENVDDSPSFWTTCPYCYYMYEYPREYVECVLRCETCERAFQAVRIQSPPMISEDQESYYYCWGFFPLAISMSHMKKDNGGSQTKSNWAPFSPLCDVSSQVKEHFKERDKEDLNEDLNSNLNEKSAPKKYVFSNVNLGPTVYIDDETDDIFEGISEPSDDDSDTEWNSVEKKKAKRMKKERVTHAGNGNKKNSSSIPASRKSTGVTTRRQSVRAAKEMGRLDLNVEFNNNEGEEPAARAGTGNRGNGQGEGDNIEGIGFFEGLDEFFSSLPILSVVNDDKVKAA